MIKKPPGLCRRFLHREETKAVFVIIQHAFVFQTAQLYAQAAAVDGQIIRQPLPVKGDGEGGAASVLGLCEQIGQQLFPGCALGGDERALMGMMAS